MLVFVAIVTLFFSSHHGVLVLYEIPDEIVLGRRRLVKDHGYQLPHLHATAHVLERRETKEFGSRGGEGGCAPIIMHVRYLKDMDHRIPTTSRRGRG